MRPSLIRFFHPALAGLVLLLGSAGCTNSTDPDGLTAKVRLLNGVTTAPALEVLAEGRVVIPGVPLGQSSGYADVPVSSTVLEVRNATTGAMLETVSAQFTAGERYTVLATASAINLQAAALVDTGLAKPDKANFRIVNVAPPFSGDSANTPPPIPLDVHITAPGVALAGRQSELSMDARYPSYSSLMYFEPGSWVVRFALPGSATVVAASEPKILLAGAVLAALLERRLDGSFQVTLVAE
jgi:hypothetical protein